MSKFTAIDGKCDYYMPNGKGLIKEIKNYAKNQTNVEQVLGHRVEEDDTTLETDTDNII